MIGRCIALAGAVMALASPPPSWAQAAGAPSEPAKAHASDSCVYITQLQNNRPLGDRSVIFRANVSDFYRMDFAQRCTELTYPEPVIILTPFAGVGLICHALDVDVKVRQQGPGSIGESCIPSRWHKMTSAEVTAIPKKDLP